MATITKRSTKPLAARGLAALAKAPTGIKDLDEVTGGGLPRGAGFLVDPISDLIGVGTACDVSAMLTRQVDFPKARA
jgi:hypothetical protein